MSRRFGAFTLIEELGRGGAGSTHLARTDSWPDEVVVKILHPKLVEDEESVRRFLHEAKVAARVDNIHVVRVLDSGVAEGSPFLVLEHVKGWSLTRILMALSDLKQLPPISAVTEIIAQALEGLRALHGDPEVVHRDLSPNNLMITPDGLVRLIDFGLSRSPFQDWRTSTGVVMGTLGYMSPEQTRGEPVDATADLYALAIVFFELLTLRRYFDPRDRALRMKQMLEPKLKRASEFRLEIRPELDRILERALAVDRALRYPDADRFRRDLLAANTPSRAALVELLEQTMAAEKPTVLAIRPEAAPPERRASMWIGVGVLVVAAVFLGIAATTQVDPAPRARAMDEIRVVPKPRVESRPIEERVEPPVNVTIRPQPSLSERSTPASTEETPVFTPAELFEALTKRADELRAEHPEHAAAIDAILARAARWAASRDDRRVLVELERSKAELDRLVNVH